MVFRAFVEASDYIPSEDEGEHIGDEEDGVLLNVEFEDDSFVSSLKYCVRQIEKHYPDYHFSVVTADYLFVCLEQGGEVDRSDVDDLLEEIDFIQEGIDSISFDSPEKQFQVEKFIEDIRNLIEASQETESSIEFLNNEFTSFADEEEAEEEAEVPMAHSEEESSSPKFTIENNEAEVFDIESSEEEELDPELEKEMMKDFQLEFGQNPDPLIDLDISPPEKKKFTEH